MIKNDSQYKYTKKKLIEFKKDLRTVREKYSSNRAQVHLLSQGYIEHISQLGAEIKDYEKMKASPLPKILRAHAPGEISRQLVRLRVARGLTQEQLARRTGCKQADISRLEREDYQGYTFNQLGKIANGLNAKIELDLIPA